MCVQWIRRAKSGAPSEQGLLALCLSVKFLSCLSRLGRAGPVDGQAGPGQGIMARCGRLRAVHSCTQSQQLPVKARGEGQGSSKMASRDRWAMRLQVCSAAERWRSSRSGRGRRAPAGAGPTQRRMLSYDRGQRSFHRSRHAALSPPREPRRCHRDQGTWPQRQAVRGGWGGEE